MALPVRRSGPHHVQIARDLGIAIVTGELPPGTVLPSEIDIAHQRGVSRSVIRESLRMLSAKGLVESRPKAGTKVRERSGWNLLDPDLLGWMFEAEPPAAFVRALFQLRLIVEPAAAELAASGRNTRQLSRLGHAMEQMTIHGLADPVGQEADQAFHHVILEATDNELLVSLSSSIGAAVRWTTRFKHRKHRQPRDSVPLHRDLYDAIANADPAAARGATVKLIQEAYEDTEIVLDVKPNSSSQDSSDK